MHALQLQLGLILQTEQFMQELMHLTQQLATVLINSTNEDPTLWHACQQSFSCLMRTVCAGCCRSRLCGG
jgi:hypothetical protein